MASFRVEFARSANKDLRSLDRQIIPRILEAIEDLENDPRPSGCRKLAGSIHTYRIRIGDYRVVYEIEDDALIVLIIRIRHRRDAYR